MCPPARPFSDVGIITYCICTYEINFIIYYPLKFVENNFFFTSYHVAIFYLSHASLLCVFVGGYTSVIPNEWNAVMILYCTTETSQQCAVYVPLGHGAIVQRVCLVARNCNIILLLCLLCLKKRYMYRWPEVFVRSPATGWTFRSTCCTDRRYTANGREGI